MAVNKSRQVDILGVKVDRLSVKQSIAMIESHINSKSTRSLLVIKPYVNFLIRSRSDPEIRRLLNQADLSLADGISLQWAASFLYGNPHSKPTLVKVLRSIIFWLQNENWITQIIPERGAGVDATVRLLRTAQRNNWRVGIIGGHSSEIHNIKRNIKSRFPSLEPKVWNGYFQSGSSEEEKIIREVKKEHLELLFIARGFPLQEIFMFGHKSDRLALVQIAEGGTFDYDQLGGRIRRAPVIIRRVGLEWLWRALVQPQKLTNLITVPYFIWLIYRAAKKQK